jgi:F0F1-type ATP synthase alpha subunit
VQEFQNAFLQYVDTTVPQLRSDLASKKELTDAIENQLKQALADFKAKAWKK